MRFLTYATEETDGLALFLASCARFGRRPEVLGRGRRFTGHGLKITLLVEHLARLDPEEVVLYTDGYDVLCLRDPEPLEDDLAHPLVFSAEPYLKLLAWNKPWHWLRYPRGRAPFPQARYLNAGCFVGRAGHALGVFSQLGLDEHAVCDQTALALYFLAHQRTLALDYEQRLFATTSGREGFEAEDFEIGPGTLRHRGGGSAPYFLHFPGKNRVGQDAVARRLGFSGLVVDGADVARYARDHRLNRRARALGVDRYGLHLVEAAAKTGLAAGAAAGVLWLCGC